MKTIKSEVKRHGIKTKTPDKPVKRSKKQEKFSESEIKNLMGTNRQTYSRHKGALRQN